MENRAHAIVAVVFLLVFSAGAILVYYWLADRPDEPLAYEIVTSQSVGGLAEQSDVRFKGLLVGHVAKLGFDPDDRSRVVMRLQLKRDAYVTHATYAVVAMQGLTGGSELELKLGKGSRAPLATSDKHPAQIPMHQSLLDFLASSARKDMQDLQDVLASARKVLDSDNRQHIAASLQQIDTATRKLAVIEAQLPALLDNVQHSVVQSHALIAHADALVRDAQTPVRDAAKLETSIQALAESSRQLSDKFNSQTVPNVDTLSESLLRTSRQLDEVLGELKAKPQSLIFGPPRHPPGPGEPGFNGGHDKDHP
ncbi:MAG TPA: MlaD family protein [Rhodanobacteraceae bacterium]|nr:MlaD family protein [Rhodanobacteraceae bacterium]